MTAPSMLRFGMFSCQVCVPSSWDDFEVQAFAESRYPAGTAKGWTIRKDNESLQGDPERNPCSNGGGMVHITLDA